jgi:hypothetical protein
MVEFRAMSFVPLLPVADPSPASALCRGVCRSLAERGYASLTEFPLANGRRADVIALGRGGDLVIVEVKSSVADFRADRKWPAYWDFCDRLYFAVAADFPRDIVPEECGLLVADAFGAALLRDPPPRTLAAMRRKALTLRFALAAATRLRRVIDPAIAEP